MITNILLVKREDSNGILSKNNLWNEVEKLEFNGLDNSALAGLIFACGFEDEAQKFEGEDYLVEFEDGGPWVFEFPEMFVKKLKSISDSEVETIAIAWASSEQLSYMNVSGSDISPVLASIVEFTKNAHTECKKLILWQSL